MIDQFFRADDPFVRSDSGLATRIYEEKLALAKTLSPPKTVCEIGVRAGYSSAVWLTAWPECHYHGLDNDSAGSGGWPGALSRAKAMLQTHFPDRWKITHYDTQKSSTLPQGPCDLVYIDGEHSYEGCLHDLRAAAKIAKRIWVDDTKHLPETVGKAVERFLQDYRVASHQSYDTIRGDMIIDLHQQPRWQHGGDFGDLLAALHTVHHFGGGELYLAQRHTRCPFTKKLVDKVYRPLLDRQPYLTQVTAGEHRHAIDMDLWRRLEITRVNIADAQGQTFNAAAAQTPWLFCDEEDHQADVIINRTHRYRSCDWAWPKVMAKYHSKVFIGHQDEWQDFQSKFGSITWIPTTDFWQVAKIVKAAKLVCCNQSSVYWLASGLGIPTWLEVDHGCDNCRIHRPGAIYFDAMMGDPQGLPAI